MIHHRVVARLIREGNERLQKYAHPDKYITAYLPGGTLFMRNPALPLEAVFPDGIPADVDQRKLNIDMSNVEPGETHAKRAFVRFNSLSSLMNAKLNELAYVYQVDSANKTWWFSD